MPTSWKVRSFSQVVLSARPRDVQTMDDGQWTVVTHYVSRFNFAKPLAFRPDCLYNYPRTSYSSSPHFARNWPGIRIRRSIAMVSRAFSALGLLALFPLLF